MSSIRRTTTFCESKFAGVTGHAFVLNDSILDLTALDVRLMLLDSDVTGVDMLPFVPSGFESKVYHANLLTLCLNQHGYRLAKGARKGPNGPL